MVTIPTTREAVQACWARETPDYSGVADGEAAGLVLTGLVRAALDTLVYRRLAARPDAIHMISGDRNSYLAFPAASEEAADNAVLLSHILFANAAEAALLRDVRGGKPPVHSLRIVVLALDEGCVVNRLDLDPESTGGVSWYGPFDPEHFGEIAKGFALFVTHVIANVFDDDDGHETFDESLDWIV